MIKKGLVICLGCCIVLVGCNETYTTNITDGTDVMIESTMANADDLLFIQEFDINWPSISTILSFIHQNDMASSYGVDSKLYAINIAYDNGRLKISFPNDSYKNNDIDNLQDIKYEYEVYDDKILQRASSNNYDVLLRYLNSKDENLAYLFNNHMSGETKNINISKFQKVGYKNKRYYIEEEVINKEYTYDIIRPYLSDDYLKEILDGAKYLGQNSLNYLSYLNTGLDSKDISFEMTLVTVPKEDNTYAFNHLVIKQKIDENLEVHMIIDGEDYYKVGRYYYFGVNSKNGKEYLKNVQVSNLLGLDLQDLNNIIDKKVEKNLINDNSVDQIKEDGSLEKFYTDRLLLSDKSYYGFSNNYDDINFCSVYFVYKR